MGQVLVSFPLCTCTSTRPPDSGRDSRTHRRTHASGHERRILGRRVALPPSEHYDIVSFPLRDLVDVHRRQIVVPVVVRGPGGALVALRFAPDLPTLRTLAVRVERVPGVAALTGPLGTRRRLPLALRAVNLHRGRLLRRERGRPISRGCTAEKRRLFTENAHRRYF